MLLGLAAPLPRSSCVITSAHPKSSDALSGGYDRRVAFCLLGPYSYLGGAFALDFGGKQAGAASSGIIDGIGYLGACSPADTVARVAGAFGWKGVFVALAGISALAPHALPSSYA